MLAVGLLALATAASASPVQPAQIVFGGSDSFSRHAGLPNIPHDEFNPLDYMSGIAPYHDAPGANIQPPDGCKVAAAAFLVRHSSIYANDDEFEEYMSPFIERVQAAHDRNVSIPSESPLAFLNAWEPLINDDNLELITEPGKEDAHALGKRFRELYGPLMPPKHLGKKKKQKGGKSAKGGKGKGKVKVPWKVWSASSERDLETSKAWVRGAFPNWQEGKEGEGDGEFVQLVAVKNKKICDAFTKETGKPAQREWLEVYGPSVRDRMNEQAPGYDFQLEDVIAAQMMCGYETVIKKERSSPFCSLDVFTPDEFKAFGYWNDLNYHYMVGYGSPVAPYLGVQWLNVSTHNLLAAYAPDKHVVAPSTFSRFAALFGKKPKLPPPSAPPDATHTQLLFVYFTHREEPPVALTALGLWNTTTESLPTDHIPEGREWQTSHLLPFLGHVAIERLHCDSTASSPPSLLSRLAIKPVPSHPKKDFVRVVVNGAPQQLPECHDGPGGSCKLADFEQFVRRRAEEFGDFEGACAKKEGGDEIARRYDSL
ncbi:hypothetical protein Rhopal_004055-T1 [Rhodotorula paludigena]|uniref:Acid phosphatase n=1 Tax=Rhodotorula paludigena TaxID=86838 RepID=A0AAV5GES9_9BASI|nr:hypothetical protein Rhopal_004055-T1 [Rhodotorula paludigena]